MIQDVTREKAMGDIWRHLPPVPFAARLRLLLGWRLQTTITINENRWQHRQSLRVSVCTVAPSWCSRRFGFQDEEISQLTIGRPWHDRQWTLEQGSGGQGQALWG
jgi:hypothetical protein